MPGWSQASQVAQQDLTKVTSRAASNQRPWHAVQRPGGFLKKNQPMRCFRNAQLISESDSNTPNKHIRIMFISIFSMR
jgi:hypothetical protein